MTQLTDKLRYDFDWWGEIGNVIFWDCGNPIQSTEILNVIVFLLSGERKELTEHMRYD